jgi:hypothetical protein
MSTPALVNPWVRDTADSRGPEGGGGISTAGGGWGRVGRIVGGAGVFFLGAGLIGWEGASALPLPFSNPDFLLASLEIGQWWRFWALHVANLRPHRWHCRGGRPWAASSAAFRRSRQATRALLRASRFFSFWAWVAILVPFVRSKKAWGPSLLRSSKMKTNITLFTFWRG